MDEGEEFIFAQTELFSRFTQQNTIIALTATSTDQESGYESLLLEHLGFRVFSAEN